MTAFKSQTRVIVPLWIKVVYTVFVAVLVPSYWIQYGPQNFLNGNNSYRYLSHPAEMFSPYFGNRAKELYDDLMIDSPLLETNLPIISK